MLFCITLKPPPLPLSHKRCLRALLFCITLKLLKKEDAFLFGLRALLFCITLKPKPYRKSAWNGLRALLFCITPKQNKSPINWTICLGNLLFNVKTADNRLIGGVIEAPKGISPFGAYSFLYVLLSVKYYFSAMR